MLSCPLLLLMACSSHPDGAFAPAQDPGGPARPATATTVTALTPTRDGHITATHPNRNSGAKDSMDVAQPLRSLVAFDQAALVAAVGAGPLRKATLRLTIGRAADNWGPNGRTVDVHRMLVPWTEVGFTWNCAIDAVPNNTVRDCSGTDAWDMTTPAAGLWAAARTGQVLVTNGMTGVVEFDVTADVAAFLAGTPNEGWVLKKSNEERQGRIVLLTRESAVPPQLLIEVGQPGDEWPLLTDTYPILDSTRTAELVPGGASYYRVDALLSFKTSTTSAQRRDLIQEFGMTVLGVTSAGNHFVRFPDPGVTIHDYWAFADRVLADPRVQYFAPIEVGGELPEVQARYPDDGAGLSRGDWLSESVSTWALRAIRAPLAWGCETGSYGDHRTRVGIFELAHRTNHPEYATQVSQSWAPSDDLLRSARVKPASAPDALRNLQHGVAVVGTVSAQGDNGMGVAGATWQSSLYLYAGSSTQARTLPLPSGFYTVAEQIAADNVEVLNFSAGSRTAAGSRVADRFQAIGAMALELAGLLKRNPKLMIVGATGNWRVRSIWRGHVQAVDTVGVLRMALMELREDVRYRDRVITVTGTELGSVLWDIDTDDPASGADVYLGTTDIAAPAKKVRVLSQWTGGPVGTTAMTGTSFAAPLVAGIAAQLYAMDPTLTPAEVKSLILRGAQVPRVDPATGALRDSLQFRIPVPGTNEHIYQADAYGALQLLSQERPGTPICGVRVWADGDGDSRRLHIERNIPEVSPGPGFVTSVAQGGRLLTAGAEYYRLKNGSWSLASTDPTATEIFFTERDTIYTRIFSSVDGASSRTDLAVRIGSHVPGRSRSETTVTHAFPGGTWGGGFQEQSVSRFSPNSDWLFLQWDWADSEYQCAGPGTAAPYGGGTYLLPLAPGLAMQTFSTYSGDRCSPSPASIIGVPLNLVGWHGTGQEFMAASLRRDQDNPTRLQRYAVGAQAGAVGPSMITSDGVAAIAWLPEGGRVEVRESDWATCLDVVRSTATLQAVASRVCTAWQPVVPLLRSPATALSGPARLPDIARRLVGPVRPEPRRHRTPIRYN